MQQGHFNYTLQQKRSTICGFGINKKMLNKHFFGMQIKYKGLMWQYQS